MLRVFIILLDENVFQNPQIFRNTLRLFPEHSTLGAVVPEHKTILTDPNAETYRFKIIDLRS
jgi:hypothetical protein